MYITVAFNRFKGYGSFWHQHYSNTCMSFFCEQPPLYFETLYGFYAIFGGSDITERLFISFLLLVTVILMFLIWKKLNQVQGDCFVRTSLAMTYKTVSSVPMLLLIAVPVFSWAFCNAVIETLVVPLSLLCFYFLLISFEKERMEGRLIYLSLFTLVLFFLLITKGVQSAFLIAAPLLGGIAGRYSFKKALLVNFLSGLIFIAGCVLFFYFVPGAHTWFDSYVAKRLVATFNHVGATASHHFEIVFRYFTELGPAFLFFVVIAVYLRLVKRYPFSILFKNIRANKTGLWLILVSLTASLPLSVTLEQRGFYLVPAFPFIVLGICFAFKRYVFYVFANLYEARRKTWDAGVIVMAVCSVLFFTCKHSDFKRDKEMLKDVGTIKKIIPYGDTIGIDGSMWNTFSLHSYLNRYNNNCLNVSASTKFYVQDKENKKPVPNNYLKLNLKTYWLDIYLNKDRLPHRASPQ